METVLMFFILIIIGAAIGGITNSLAIKMLFRPYKPVYIGKWRLPFTPGLIPKRHNDMAVQLGKVVVDHLLTTEAIQKKMRDTTFQSDMMAFVQKEATSLLERRETVQELSEKLGIEQADEKVKQFIEGKLEEKYWELVKRLKDKSIADILPNRSCEFIENKIPLLAAFITEKASAYFESAEGKQKLSDLIDQFLADKGTLGNMIHMLLGNESLLQKVQPEVIKFLEQPATKEWLAEMIAKEWTSLKQKRFAEFENYLNHAAVIAWLKKQVVNQLHIEQLMQTSLSELTKPYKTTIVEMYLPKFFAALGHYFSQQIEPLLQKLHLSDIVKEQVESFPVERLEAVVLTISRREFKMIKYLGALLGGLIGAVQGVLLLLL